MPYLSFLWSYILFQAGMLLAQLMPGSELSLFSLEGIIAQLGVAGLIFIIWLFTFRHFTKQQIQHYKDLHESYSTTLSAFTDRYERTLKEVSEQNEKIVKRLEDQNAEHQKQLTSMINRLFANQEKEFAYKEELTGVLTQLHSKLNKKD